MSTTPEEYLPVLAKKLDARQPRIALNRQYSNGDAPLPEMGKNLRASWEAFQKKARTDMAGTLCASMSGRIVPRAVTVGSTSENKAVIAARLVWRNNRLDVVFADAIWNALAVSIGYLILGTRDGRPIVTSEEPEQVITIPDPAQPWRALAALKAWRDLDNEIDYAIVWANGVKQWFSRGMKTSTGTIRGSAQGGWEATGVIEMYVGELPVFAIENARGVAEFEPHIDVIDRINLGKLQRLVLTAIQAFKQRMIEGSLPDKDADGNDVDYTKIFDAAPGAIWELPEGVKITELGADDIRPLLEGEKNDLRDFAMVTRTPIDVFIPDNQSATGAENSQKGEIQKAKDRIARFGAPMEAAILGALRVLGIDTGDTVHIQFEKPEHVGLGEKMAAAAQAKAAGKSRRWIDQHIMGMTPEEIQQEESDLAEEQLSAATLIGVAAGGTTSTPGSDPINVEAIKAKSEAMGVLIRSGTTPESAAKAVGLDGIKFSGAVPVTLRVPESKAANLEKK